LAQGSSLLRRSEVREGAFSFSTCLALRRAQRIEREVSEAEEVRAACAQGSRSAGRSIHFRRTAAAL